LVVTEPTGLPLTMPAPANLTSRSATCAPTPKPSSYFSDLNGAQPIMPIRMSVLSSLETVPPTV
jgi:hypothetical protein